MYIQRLRFFCFNRLCLFVYRVYNNLALACLLVLPYHSFVLLDCHHLTQIDASATMSFFMPIKNLTEQHKLVLSFFFYFFKYLNISPSALETTPAN